MKKNISVLIVFTLVLSLLSGCGANGAKKEKNTTVKLNMGSLVSQDTGNTEISELEFQNEEGMLASMKKAAENGRFELYYSPDNMAVALKDLSTGNTVFSNPYNAALDENYSGVIGKKLASQLVISYLENETKVVDMYSSEECAEKGQYSISVYDNGISFDLVFGTDNSSGGTFLKVLSKDTYKAVCSKISENSKDILDAYYTLYKKADLDSSGIYDLYPDMKAQDVYFIDFELSERDEKKLSAVFEEAGYSDKELNAETEKLELGESTASDPYFKFTLNYMLTDSGVTVSIPNESIEYNKDFPLLRVCLLPYFGADVPGADATGYLFIPDGSGTVINMNREEPNRRIVITGRVYGENESKLPQKVAAEKTERYCLPVFGTVRNNGVALFGNVISGDANCEITAILGRPNGNYYTANPEFIVRDYEQYTRVSVVENAWSNKSLYLYEKNASKDDFTVQYTVLSGDKANYSGMAEVYGEYIFGKDKKSASKSTLNLQTLGSAIVEDSFLGFNYDSESVFTSYEDNISILKYLKKNKAGNLSLMLKGWQKDGLDAAVSNKIRISSDQGGKSALKELAKYCKNSNIPLSLYNNLSFVGFDNSFDGFKPKSDAARTLELKYAKKSVLSPDTQLYDEGKYVVKASSYYKYLSGLTKNADDYLIDTLNIGELGSSLSADYTKNGGINRGDALGYVKAAIKDNKDIKLSFDNGNAYVLPYAEDISDISVDNSGFPGETAAVPFIQMVLGGKVAFSSEPVNLKANLRAELLKCIEGGTVPTFLLSYGNTSSLKKTAYTAYYSVDYKILRESIIESYKYVDKVVSATNGTNVINHEILSDGVSVSTYKNGAKIYVNKTDKDFAAGEITVKANDYAIGG